MFRPRGRGWFAASWPLLLAAVLVAYQTGDLLLLLAVAGALVVTVLVAIRLARRLKSSHGPAPRVRRRQD